MRPIVAVVLGTYNRETLLRKCIKSVRRSVGSLPYEIIVVDGGSTDGSRLWLRGQSDVRLIAQGKLLGATRAYNAGFAVGVDDGAQFLGIVNDDDELIGPNAEIDQCVDIMRHHADIGAVAFESDLRGTWACECWRDKPSCGKGVVRRNALMAVARAQGDPAGHKFWSEEWRTYAADSQAGILIHKLGWRVAPGVGLRVHDNAPNGLGGDAMRSANVKEYLEGGGAALFTQRWSAPDCDKYDRALAEKCGGRLL